MKNVFPLGAINKLTKKYVYPKIANKKDEYTCPECEKDVTLCQGEINIHHFRHKVDSVNPCHRYNYNSTGESQIHKDGKMLLKTLLEEKTPIKIIRKCCSCKEDEENTIPEISETSVIQLEHHFEYNNGKKIADVAYIDDGEIVCLFEICHTHKTLSENRPDDIDWFEIDAKNLIKIANENHLPSLEIQCIRCEKCEECIKAEEKQLKIKELEEKKKFYNECLITEQRLYDKIRWGPTNTEEEKSAIKTCANAIKKYQKKISIIKKELDILTKPILTKEQKLAKLEQEYREQRGDLDYLYQDSRYRFTKNDVEYTLSNHGFDIIHPLKGQKIKMSFNGKVFINGKWWKYNYPRGDLTCDIINWYHNKPINHSYFKNLL